MKDLLESCLKICVVDFITLWIRIQMELDSDLDPAPHYISCADPKHFFYTAVLFKLSVVQNPNYCNFCRIVFLILTY